MVCTNIQLDTDLEKRACALSEAGNYVQKHSNKNGIRHIKPALVWGTVILGRPFIEHFVGSSSSIRTDPVYVIIGVIGATSILGVILYMFLKVDWAKIIGKRFPWTTVEGDESEE